MKKVLFAVMAMIAIGFTSCGNKTQSQTEVADTEVTINAEEEAAATINALTEQIEAKDASKLQEVIESVKEKVVSFITSDPEAAKEYVQKVQAFLKDNAEKIKEFVGDNEAVNAAISSLTEAPADKIVSGLASLGEGINNAAEAAQDKASEAVEDAKDAAKDKANEMKDAAKEKTSEAIDAAADKAKSLIK